MTFYPGLVPLRDVLAELYPAEGAARVVVGGAGLAPQMIDFDGAANEFWASILSVAQGNNQVQDVIDIARATYSTNERLMEAERIFRETPVPDLAGVPESGDAPSPGDNVNIFVGGDNPGVIGGRDVQNVKVVNVRDIAGDGNVVGIDIEADVTIGGKPAGDEEPSLDLLRQMILELQSALDSVAAQDDLLSQVGPADSATTQGAANAVTAVVADLEADPDNINADSIQQQLSTAATLLEATLDRAKTLAEKADAAGKAIVPLVEQMGPVVAKIAMAASWAVQLWPAG